MKELSENFVVDIDTDWKDISENYILPKKFIIKNQNRIDWQEISYSQKLSEKFIIEFQDKVYWKNISHYQKLSENFIKEFQDKVYWEDISYNQKLSEKFISKHENKVNWENISKYQVLSEKFIIKYRNDLCWICIFKYQQLSTKFKNELYYDLAKDMKNQPNKKIRIARAKSYAKTNKLKIDNQYIYAFRNHNKLGNGMFLKNSFYEKGKYYRDWHCDHRKYILDSYGFGIFPKGNTIIRVKLEDFCVSVFINKKYDIARVWGFEII